MLHSKCTCIVNLPYDALAEQDTVRDVMQRSGEIILIDHPLLLSKRQLEKHPSFVKELLRQEAPCVVAVQDEAIHVAITRFEEAELLEEHTHLLFILKLKGS